MTVQPRGHQCRDDDPLLCAMHRVAKLRELFPPNAGLTRTSRPLRVSAGLVNLAVYTTPHTNTAADPEPAIVAAVKAARKSIVMSVYSFTLVALADALVDAVKRGVAVTVVADFSESKQLNNQLSYLLSNGVEDIHIWGTSYILNHEKVIVVDGDLVCSGSYNYTTQAEKSNREILTIAYGIQVTRTLAPLVLEQIMATYTAGKVMA